MKTPRLFLKAIISVSAIFALAFPAASEETFEPNTPELNPSYEIIQPFDPYLPEADTGLIDILKEQFGEPNNTEEGAYILDTDPPWLSTYEAALSCDEDSADIDFYRIYSPAHGTPYFSGWLKVTVHSQSGEELRYTIWTPQEIHSSTITTSESRRSRNHWVGLAREASVMIAVELAFNCSSSQPVPYSITIASGLIDDNYESDDEEPDFDDPYFSNDSCDASDPHCLSHVSVRSSYAAPVFDASGNVVGLSDNYYFYHKSCHNEAVKVTRPLYMGFFHYGGSSKIDPFEPRPHGYAEDGWWDVIDQTGEILTPGWTLLSINNWYREYDPKDLCFDTDDRIIDDNNLDGVPDYYQIPYVFWFIDTGIKKIGDCENIKSTATKESKR